MLLLTLLLGTPLSARADDLIVLLTAKSCPRCQLADADLVHADLRDADLSAADLQRANLALADQRVEVLKCMVNLRNPLSEQQQTHALLLHHKPGQIAIPRPA